MSIVGKQTSIMSKLKLGYAENVDNMYFRKFQIKYLSCGKMIILNSLKYNSFLNHFILYFVS